MNQLSDQVVHALWFEEDDPHHANFEASHSLAAQVAKVAGLKPFPVVAQKVSQMVARPECRIEELGRVIETDPSLAGRLMRLANSALFRIGDPASTLEQALVRLGTSTTYQLVTALAVMGLFPGKGKDAERVRAECVGAAAIARGLARSARHPGAGQAFLCGLMHDLGKLLLMQTGELDYSERPEEGGGEGEHDWERSKLGYDHAVLGGHVMTLWGLPPIVSEVVAWHHQPKRAYAEGGEVADLMAFVTLADVLEPAVASADTLPRDLAEHLESFAALSVLSLDVDKLCDQWSSLKELRSQAVGSI